MQRDTWNAWNRIYDLRAGPVRFGPVADTTRQRMNGLAQDVAEVCGTTVFSLPQVPRLPTVGAMGYIVLWLPLVWALRFLLLVLTGGILYVSTLYLARFLRPENARALYSGSLPALTRVEGTAKVLGQELTVNADVQGPDRLSLIEERVRVLEIYVQELKGAAAHFVDTDSVDGGIT